MASVTTAELLQALRHFQLLDPARLKQLDESEHADDPAALADDLVGRGWLTQFQADYLLQGRGAALTVGSYLLLDRLGKGGMGEVFKAWQQRLSRIVALKVIRSDHLDHPGSVERFLREAKAAAKLHHPNVVTIYDTDQAGGIFFIAMEYVEGTDLSRYTKQAGPLPVHQACAYARQAALGLQHAHEHHLVHRDIKPSNLIITAQGAPTAGIHLLKILDFGLARSEATDYEALTPTDQWIGTPDFISPEQARSSKDVDIRSDIFSLGCALYYLLTGKAAFSGSNRVEKLVARLEGEATPISAFRPQVPAQLHAVLARMLARSPADRFQTPLEVAQALEPFCTGEEAAAALAGATELPRSDEATITGAKGSSERTLDVDQRRLDTAPPAVPSGSSSTSPLAGSFGSRWRLAAIAAALLVIAGLIAAPLVWKKPPGPAESFVNSIGMKLMRIPAGSFQMGAAMDEADHGDDEVPAHPVAIARPFYIGAYEVTQAEYLAVMNVNPSHFAPLGEGADQIADVADPGKLPVESVTWDDAVEFCTRLTEREHQDGRSYRLPTEAEWEYACRAATTTPFHYGRTLSAADANMNGRLPYGGAPAGSARQFTMPVGSFRPNAWGLFDMHGNVWEWCGDRYAEYAEKLKPGGPMQTFGRVVRGGAWNFQGADCRAAKRIFHDQDYRSKHVGFRVVCEP